MYVRELKLTNVRQFAERKFSFQPGFNLIVGENGAGKTTLLRSLQAVLARSPQTRQRLQDEDVRLRSDALKISAQLASPDGGQVHSATYTRLLNHRASRKGVEGAPRVLSYASNEATCGSFLGRRARRFEGHELSGRESGERWLFQQQERPKSEESPQPHFGHSQDIREFVLEILSKFSPRFRDFQWSFEPFDCTVLPDKDHPEGNLDHPRLRRLLQSAIMRYLAETENPLAHMDAPWLIIRSDGLFQDTGKRRRITPSFKELMSRAKATASDVRFYEQSAVKVRLTPRVRIQDQSGDPLLISQLSDGEQRLFSLFVDIARQLSLEEPGATEFGGVAAIVLIDEIDVHLHPKWQRTVVQALESLFPACQFIATTHSPFVIQSLKAGKLIELNPDTSNRAPEYSGKGIEDIAEDVMGIEVPQRSERHVRMMAAAENYFRLLRDSDATPSAIAEAEARLHETTERFGDDPAFQALIAAERAAPRTRRR